MQPTNELHIRTRSLGVPGDHASMRQWQDRIGELSLRELVGGYRVLGRRRPR